MDSQVRGKGNRGFLASKNNSQKKMKSHQKFAQVNKPLSREDLKKNSNFLSQTNYQAQKNFNSQPSWSIFSSGSEKSNNSVYKHRDSGRSDNQQFYAKNDNRNYNRGYYSDKNPRFNNYASTSDSDSYNSDPFSELSGFKVVQNGETLHDDTYEDTEQQFDDEVSDFGMALAPSKEKFASSELTMMPNFKAISIPLFLQA